MNQMEIAHELELCRLQKGLSLVSFISKDNLNISYLAYNRILKNDSKVGIELLYKAVSYLNNNGSSIDSLETPKMNLKNIRELAEARRSL